MIPTIFLISVATFVIIQLPPGNYLDTMISDLRASGEKVEALGQNLLDPFEAVATGDGRRVDDRDLERVHVERGRLHVEEARVQTRQPLHRSSIAP